MVHFLSWERGRAQRVRRGIAAASGSISISISYDLADLEDLDAVRVFARDFCATHDRIDVLIRNAGAIHPRFGTDTAGTELTIAGQVVAPFLLTACRCPRWSGLSKPLAVSGPGDGSGRAGRCRLPVPGKQPAVREAGDASCERVHCGH